MTRALALMKPPWVSWFCFAFFQVGGATLGYAEGLLLTLHSGLLPEVPTGPSGMPGLEPRWAMCKASALPALRVSPDL